MSKRINGGGPAFPVHSVSWKEKDGTECVGIGTHGMTLRDYFAAQALAGILSCDARAECDDTKAEWAYSLADAMLFWRKEASK